MNNMAKLPQRMTPEEKDAPFAIIAKRCKRWSTGEWVLSDHFYDAIIIATKYYSYSMAIGGKATNGEISAL